MDRSRRLEEESIPRLMLSFSAPAIVGLLTQALYVVIDRWFVARALGDESIAGVTVCFPFMLLLMAFSMLVGFGGAAVVSLRLGQKRRDEAQQVLGNAAVLLLAASLLTTVAGWLWMEPLLRLFGASHDVMPLAREYMRVIVLGSVFQIVGFGLNSIIRGEGNPRMSMVTMLVSVALNALLAPLLIFVLRWGMTGAALATVVAQAVSAVWVVSYFRSRRSLLRLEFSTLRPRWSLCREILVIGSPPFMLQIAAAVSQCILFNQLERYGGDTAVSVVGVIHSVVMTIAMPIFGINQGAQPIIGYNYGARKFDRVKAALQTAILGATSVAVLGYAVVMVFPAQLFGFFSSSHSELVQMGTPAMRLSMCLLPVVGFQIVGSNYFQAVGKPSLAMILSLSRQVLLLIPATLLLPRLWGLTGVWLALPTADFCSALLTGTCLFWETRQLYRQHAESLLPSPELAPTNDYL